MRDRLDILFRKQLDGQLTPGERIELMGLFLEPALQPRLLELSEAAWDKTGEEEGLTEEKKEAIFRQIIEQAETDAPVINLKAPRKFIWKRWAAAAVILLMVSAGSYLIMQVKTPPSPVTKTDDVRAPATNRAMITLADGTKVYLDSAANGQLALQANVKVVKTANGQIAYEKINTGEATEPKYNTLENPNGSNVIDMTLADGSRVWLNAGSSVTYPVVFTGNERKVTVTGEAYFEVTHDVTKPFIVSKGETSVQVLGTHFNVNAYDDEAATRITLLEGSIKVANGEHTALIKPGEQAIVTGNQSPVINNGIDTDEVMAWKNNLFHFESADVKFILRQFARWYDVEIIYEGEIKDRKFFGIVSRGSSLSNVLKMLKANDFSFRIEGRKLYVTKG